MSTEVEPTPPVAPVTRIGPDSGVMPWSWSAMTESAAVNPAVPITIESRIESPSGTGIREPAGTRANSAYPP